MHFLVWRLFFLYPPPKEEDVGRTGNWVWGGTGRGSCVAVRHRRRVWERDPETVKVNVAVGGGSRANVKTAGESFSHEITNC